VQHNDLAGSHQVLGVVLVDVALPNHLHGDRQYRRDWIAVRNWLCDVLKLVGVTIYRRCRYAYRIMMALLFADPIYDNTDKARRRAWDRRPQRRPAKTRCLMSTSRRSAAY
jgi:hypothetical protein